MIYSFKAAVFLDLDLVMAGHGRQDKPKFKPISVEINRIYYNDIRDQL
jgi:hypothetical protein